MNGASRGRGAVGVTGGFAEVSATAASILAEQAVPRAEADADMISELLASAEKDLAEAPDEAKMAAGQRVRDVLALSNQLGA